LHIQRDLKKIGVSHEFKKLDFGDYSFTLDGKDYSQEIVIERKKNFDEIISNIIREGRFYREFHYARKKGIKVIILIEQTEYDLKNKNYRSKMKAYEIMNMLNEFRDKYLVPMHFVERGNAAKFVIDTFKKHIGLNKR